MEIRERVRVRGIDVTTSIVPENTAMDTLGCFDVRSGQITLAQIPCRQLMEKNWWHEVWHALFPDWDETTVDRVNDGFYAFISDNDLM